MKPALNFKVPKPKRGIQASAVPDGNSTTSSSSAPAATSNGASFGVNVARSRSIDETIFGTINSITSNCSEPEAEIATKVNRGNKGRRKYIDYDDKPAKRSKETENDEDRKVKKVRTIASMDGLDGGAMQLFAGAKRGSKGIRKAMQKHAERSSVLPTHFEVQKFPVYASKCDPDGEAWKTINGNKASVVYKEWLWQTQLDFNILVYGVGDKTDILLDFQKNCLHDEDCVGIDGWPQETSSFSFPSSHRTPDESFRCLLDMIWVDIMGKSLMDLDSHAQDSLERYLEDLLSALDEHYKLTTKEMHGLSRMSMDLGKRGGTGDDVDDRLQEFRQHRLYILVFGLDGPLLASPNIIELLSKLASRRMVSVIGKIFSTSTI